MLSPFWLSACCFAHFSCMLCLDGLNNFPPKISSNFLGRSSIFCSAFFVAFVFVYKKTHRYNRCVLIIHLKSNRTNAISNGCQVTDSKSRRTSSTKPPNQTETAKRRAGNPHDRGCSFRQFDRYGFSPKCYSASGARTPVGLKTRTGFPCFLAYMIVFFVPPGCPSYTAIIRSA